MYYAGLPVRDRKRNPAGHHARHTLHSTDNAQLGEWTESNQVKRDTQMNVISAAISKKNGFNKHTHIHTQKKEDIIKVLAS